MCELTYYRNLFNLMFSSSVTSYFKLGVLIVASHTTNITCFHLFLNVEMTLESLSLVRKDVLTLIVGSFIYMVANTMVFNIFFSV